MKSGLPRVPGVKVRMNEELSVHTSFHIGGRARYFLEVYSKRALVRVLKVIANEKLPYYVIGCGTNVLVADSGLPGAVLRLGGAFKRMNRHGNVFRCGAGVAIENFLDEAVRVGSRGAEFLAGIPGTLGGAVKGNAGAFGRSIADLIDRVFLMDEQGAETVRTRNEIAFTYRSSDIGNGYIITGVSMRLRKGTSRAIRQSIERNLAARQKRQPDGYSAGSFFKNPPGRAAGELIEICGLKGASVGDAEVSRKHGNYIINKGHARAVDVLALAEMIRKTVRMQTGIELEAEVRLLR
ncbi:UDP-N-acetylmuramate dehydrogenase [candidate division WOR-3 bacterium]|nr:UDP-N-acetylmuramate dehydrogenase [candidate division WOR-3 bacterium]